MKFLNISKWNISSYISSHNRARWLSYVVQKYCKKFNPVNTEHQMTDIGLRQRELWYATADRQKSAKKLSRHYAYLYLQSHINGGRPIIGNYNWYCQSKIEHNLSIVDIILASWLRWRCKRCIYIKISGALIYATDHKLYLTRGQSNLTKSASRGAHSPVRGHPRGRKLYHWIPEVGFPISVPYSNYRPRMHRLATVHARDNQRPTTSRHRLSQ